MLCFPGLGSKPCGFKREIRDTLLGGFADATVDGINPCISHSKEYAIFEGPSSNAGCISIQPPTIPVTIFGFPKRLVL